MRVGLKYFPEDIQERCNLKETVDADRHVYIQIKWGMYSLKQAAYVAYEHLKKQLQQYGYQSIVGTVGLLWHRTRKTKFCFSVDNFGIKYYSNDDAQHLFTCLSKHYKHTGSWAGNNYCGMTLDWQYQEGYFAVSMPGYVDKVSKQLQHEATHQLQHTSHIHVQIIYGKQGCR